MPSLILIKSPGGTVAPQTFPLTFPGKPQLVIGRQKDRTPTSEPADIVIDDGKMSVSRHHIAVSVAGGQFYVQDLSRNGSLLGNKPLSKVAPMPIKDGDTLKICDFLFRFVDERKGDKAKLPSHMVPNLPDPADEPSTEMTTVQHTVNRTAAQEFLELQPTERLRALLDISTTLSRAIDLEHLLPSLVDAVFATFKQADRCFIIQLDDAGRPYTKVVKARRGGTDHRFSRTLLNRCLDSMQSYLIKDASTVEGLGSAQSIAEFRIRSVMCAPLATADGKPLGAILMDTQDISKSFSEEDLKLLTIVANLASVAVEKAHMVTALLRQEKTEGEIELAKQVQLGFLPQNEPVVPGYEFFGFYSAAQTVGGDYYDYISLPDGRLAVVLGDVAGKGVPASLLMAKLSAEARFCMLTQPDLAKAVSLLSNQLIKGGIGDRYVTLVALVLDPVTHEVTFVNAGHMMPLRYCPAAVGVSDCDGDDSSGIPLGIQENFEYTSVRVTLEPGQSLTVFTDGVTDAMNPLEVMFDEVDGVRAAVATDAADGGDLGPRELGKKIVAAVRKHAAGRPQNDDIALVTFGRVDGPSGPITSGPDSDSGPATRNAR
jgi:serine phosphatase RsbU (regulator of sigma subunit)